MDNPNYTIEHRKGQHLLAEERHEIEVRLRDGWSPYKIAKTSNNGSEFAALSEWKKHSCIFHTSLFLMGEGHQRVP